MVSKENYKNLPNVIFTTLLIEKSPQAIPLGAACVASAVKNHKKTKDLCKTTLLVFNKEDKSYHTYAYGWFKNGVNFDSNLSINYKLHQAINKQIEELGWK